MDPFITLQNNTTKNNLIREIVELGRLTAAGNAAQITARMQLLENGVNGLQEPVQQVQQFAFQVPEHNLEDIFILPNYTRPKPMVHYRVENGKNYYNTNQACFNIVDPDRHASRVRDQARLDGEHDPNILQEIYIQARLDRVDQNTAAEQAPPNWVLCQRSEPNNANLEDTLVRFTPTGNNEVDWHATVRNLHNFGRNYGYTLEHYSNAMNRFISFFKPEMTSLIENMDANETARFLMSLNTPVPAKKKHFQALKLLSRKAGTPLRSVMNVLQIRARGYYADEPAAQIDNLVETMLVQGLQAFTTGRTNAMLKTTVQQRLLDNDPLRYNELLETAILSEETLGMPTMDLPFAPNSQPNTFATIPLFNSKITPVNPLIQAPRPLVRPLVNIGLRHSNQFHRLEYQEPVSHFGNEYQDMVQFGIPAAPQQPPAPPPAQQPAQQQPAPAVQPVQAPQPQQAPAQNPVPVWPNLQQLQQQFQDNIIGDQQLAQQIAAQQLAEEERAAEEFRQLLAAQNQAVRNQQQRPVPAIPIEEQGAAAPYDEYENYEPALFDTPQRPAQDRPYRLRETTARQRNQNMQNNNILPIQNMQTRAQNVPATLSPETVIQRLAEIFQKIDKLQANSTILQPAGGMQNSIRNATPTVPYDRQRQQTPPRQNYQQGNNQYAPNNRQNYQQNNQRNYSQNNQRYDSRPNSPNYRPNSPNYQNYQNRTPDRRTPPRDNRYDQRRNQYDRQRSPSPYPNQYRDYRQSRDGRDNGRSPGNQTRPYSSQGSYNRPNSPNYRPNSPNYGRNSPNYGRNSPNYGRSYFNNRPNSPRRDYRPSSPGRNNYRQSNNRTPSPMRSNQQDGHGNSSQTNDKQIILGVNCNPNYTRAQGLLCSKCNSFGRHEEHTCPHYYHWAPMPCSTCNKGFHNAQECLKTRPRTPDRRSPSRLTGSKN
jgi:hypothetical protein